MNHWPDFLVGFAIGVIIVLPIWLLKHAKPEPPQVAYDLDLEAEEQAEFERLYGRLRWHVDVAMQRGKEQLL